MTETLSHFAQVLHGPASEKKYEKSQGKGNHKSHHCDLNTQQDSLLG